MKKRLNIYEGTVFALIIFSFSAVLIKGSGMSDFIIALLSVSSFLFGIFIAFSISDRHARLKELRETLRNNDALILNTYKLSSAFETSTQTNCRRLIDSWITSTLDYYLIDFDKSQSKFLKFYEFILSLKPKDEKQKLAYEQMLINSGRVNEQNTKINYLVKDRMYSFEWASILMLGCIILFCLFYINTNSLESIMIIILLSTAVAILVLVLSELDSLFWKEQSWIWNPIKDKFKELDLLPYFPDDVFIFNRIKIPPGLKYRVAHYPHTYPNMQDKKIEIIG